MIPLSLLVSAYDLTEIEEEGLSAGVKSVYYKTFISVGCFRCPYAYFFREQWANRGLTLVTKKFLLNMILPVTRF
jgi:predicted nucleic-acid-binding Zn-ribbon protein